MPTITVASLSPVPILIEAEPDRDGQPGKRVELAAAADHALGIEAKTEHVDSDLFHGWVARNRHHPAVMAGMLRIAPDEGAKPKPRPNP